MDHLIFSILATVLISGGSFLVHGSDVPALIWSPTRSMDDLPQVFVGKKINAANFHSEYLLPLSKGTRSIVVFLQDKLGLNHLSQYADIYNHNGDGGAFKNVKHFMEDYFSTNLPSVSDPMAAIESLKKNFHNNFVEVHNPSKIASMKLNKDKAQLLLVHLPDLTGSTDEETTIRNNDDLIAKMLKQLSDRGVDYSAMLIGEHSTDEVENDSNYMGRHLLQVDESNASYPIYLDFPNCPFYAESIIININQTNITSYHMATLVSKNSTCSNRTAIMSFELMSVNSTLTAVFNIEFVLSNLSDWTIDTFEVDYKLNGQPKNSTNIDARFIYAPKVFSYHCTKLPVLKEVNGTSISILLKGFQVQPYDGYNGTFTTNVWDCTGFFSIGIWMGLFSTLILGMIIAFGLCMIMDIKTMDRFDDPKGKMFTALATDG